jgi:GrpB-like predicted nucleotidyltransferase (UPF0157 family)
MAACRGRVLEVFHIGSTAIPGIAAKPIVDVMPILRSPEAGRECIELMAEHGYEYRGENGIAGRFYFKKKDAIAQNVHMFCRGDPNIDRHIRFRDYLVGHPEEIIRYEELKRRLAAEFPTDGRAYADAKSDFCARIDALSREGSPG